MHCAIVLFITYNAGMIIFHRFAIFVSAADPQNSAKAGDPRREKRSCLPSLRFKKKIPVKKIIPV